MADWDARYAEEDRIWSGEPNEALVAEVSDLPPGRALDVGCGEGADAVWLARRGWRVRAIDVSSVALGRARMAGSAAGVEVEWQLTGLGEMRPPEGGFDLVSTCYPALPKDDGQGLRALTGAVAPGGTLLVVHHAEFDLEQARAHGFDPADFLTVEEVAGGLDEQWEVLVHEVRDRHVSGGSGAHHTRDRVLRARRR